jgi:hypothetical protein
MPANKHGESCPAVSRNRTCRTFTSLSDFRNYQASPTSRTALGESAPLSSATGGQGGEIPRWRVELLRRPLRRVVKWASYMIPAESKFRLPEVRMYRETLECGHKAERMESWEPPAKRRRCKECGR